MKFPFPEYEFPVHGVARVSGRLPVAGVYFLDGRCHMVGEGSPAEQELTGQGALRVATVRFDRDPMEGAGTGHPVRPLGLREAVERFLRSPVPGPVQPAGRLPQPPGADASS